MVLAFSKKYFKAYLSIVVMFFLLTLLFASNIGDLVPYWILDFGYSIKDIRSLAERSEFKEIVIFDYMATIFIPPILAFVAMMGGIDANPMRVAASEFSATKRILVFLFFLVIIFTPFIAGNYVSQLRYSYSFYSALGKSKALTLIWFSSMFLLFLGSWIWCLCEIFNLARRMCEK